MSLKRKYIDIKDKVQIAEYSHNEYLGFGLRPI